MVETTKTEKYLRIGKKKIKGVKKGRFMVKYSDILDEDISTLEPGTILAFDYHPRKRATSDLVIELMSIRVEKNGTVQVIAYCFYPQNHWKHALSYPVFMFIASKIFYVSASDKFMGLGLMKNYEQQPVEGFKLIARNGRFKAIHEYVHDLVKQMLQPLLDFRDSVDAQAQKQFGLKL